MSQRSSILVTGATGFIGRTLCRELVRREYPVVGTIRRRAAEQDEAGLRYVGVGSIDERTEWSAALQGVDKVVHLAGRAHVTQRRGDADDGPFCRQVNRAGTLRLAEAAAAAGATRFVFISTAKVHGDRSPDRPFVEDDLPHPGDPYAASKVEAEEALRQLGTGSGMEIVILRPPLVYGAGVKANFLSLMQWIDSGIPLPLGSVRNRRSLIYVENLVSAIVQCLERDAAAGRTYLVSDGEDLSTPRLIRMLSEGLGKRPRLLSIPPGLLRGVGRLVGRSGSIDRLAGSMSVDSSRIRRELCWAPPFDLRGGIRKTAAWYRDDRCNR